MTRNGGPEPEDSESGQNASSVSPVDTPREGEHPTLHVKVCCVFVCRDVHNVLIANRSYFCAWENVEIK
jgi:hypothetical protein